MQPTYNTPDPLALDSDALAVLDRACALDALWPTVRALWPDWASSTAIAHGQIVDECTLVDAFGCAWGLDSTQPYLMEVQ